MTDTEITKACAEAMGLEVAEQLGMMMFLNTQFEVAIYGPLENDAQAMALVKKFELGILRNGAMWEVVYGLKWGRNSDLNRAICECVYKLHTAKRVA